MSQENYTTETRKGQHLDGIERGKIEGLKRAGYSNRAIARALGRSPSTIANELKRGTPEKNGKRGRQPVYHARVGQRMYEANRKRCRRGIKLLSCKKFATWVIQNCKENKWSFDACVGRARLQKLYDKNAMVCTKTLYNAVNRGIFKGLTPFDMPEILKRRIHRKQKDKAVRPKGTSIDERPPVVDELSEIGHWEIDTVIGKRSGKGSVVMSLVERETDNYLAVRIDGKTSEAVLAGLKQLREEYGSKFSTIFKTITADNGSEFTDLSSIEGWGTGIYFAHPYSSWERAKNERHNRMLRRYLPKGKSMDEYSAEEIEAFADTINALPRRRLNYGTPNELFEAFLDGVYATK